MCGMITRKEQAAGLRTSERNTVALYDSEVTPKIIRPVARNSSAVAFLKTERNQRRLNADLTSCSVRGVQNSFKHLNKDDIQNISHQRRSSHSTSERSFSRTSNVFMRALTGRCHQKPKLSPPMNHDQFMSFSTPSSHRSSRSKKSSSSSTQLDSRSSEYLDTKNYYHNAYIHDANTSLDALIPVQKNQDPELKSEILSAIAQPLDTFILCPEIEITPEISAIGTKSCDLWVAVEVKGSLKKADGSSGKGTTGQSLITPENGAIKSQYAEAFGFLESLKVRVEAGKDCKIDEIIGDYKVIQKIKANQTHLIILRMQFREMVAVNSARTISSQDLITELQTDLGATRCPYITVKLSYVHSGFRVTEQPLKQTSGISSHKTWLHTEATALIMRYNPNSAWSPHIDQKTSLAENPILNLIETNFHKKRAQDAIRRIAVSKSNLPSARRLVQTYELFTDNNKEPDHILQKKFDTPHNSPIQQTKESNSVTLRALTHKPHEFSEEIDPAHKIWVDMRRNSRRRCTEVKPDVNQGSRLSNQAFKKKSIYTLGNHESTGLGRVSIEQERNWIREVALRNKRSLGAETLKSIAPSVVETQFPKLTDECTSGIRIGKSWWVGLFV
ncbi:Bgt-4525-2 [Blumeria graminis f. sp. tritici]|uniref:Bgt-4525-2 n=2 Tax=Blumeria graminis f. sp. tritici TaxID=62690 RepID=A0A061HK84_BLUGR|nr:hypothetical protein BGT96224_4525B [Blumeria graminis f. sp. tritici 96224]VDB94017.1 Bgt-4525-2 [Blumeria graminis f. sp. tritici]